MAFHYAVVFGREYISFMGMEFHIRKLNLYSEPVMKIQDDVYRAWNRMLWECHLGSRLAHRSMITSDLDPKGVCIYAAIVSV